MYLEDFHDINPGKADPPADTFDDWAMSLDAWLDTPAGQAWLAEQDDVASMARNAECFGSRPGLGGRHHG